MQLDCNSGLPVLQFPAFFPLNEDDFVRKYFCLLSFMCFPALALAQHAHGVAALEVSIEGDLLSIELEAPLHDLLGFERAPKYEKDLAKVREVAALLRAGDKLFAPAAAAGCVLSSVKLESDVIAPELLGEKVPPAAKADAHGHEHADLDAHYQFKCAKPAELKRIEVNTFDSFKRLRFINAQLVVGKIQRATKLSAKSRTLSW